jgi:hypothetical protein
LVNPKADGHGRIDVALRDGKALISPGMFSVNTDVSAMFNRDPVEEDGG